MQHRGGTVKLETGVLDSQALPAPALAPSAASLLVRQLPLPVSAVLPLE